MLVGMPVVDQPIFIYPPDKSVYALVDQVQNATCYIETDEWSGSGVYVGDGRILTARHVIEDANTFCIRFRDGTEFNVGKENAYISDNIDSDVGVILCEGMEGLKPLKLSDSNSIREGDEVFICGCPYGEELAFTVTRGMVSGIGREVSSGLFGVEQVITADAASWPGNSGGPVVDSNGNLIGIVVGGVGRGDNMSVIIFSNTCQRVLDELNAN